MNTAAAVRPAGSGIRLDIRVTPRASRTGIEGLRNGRLVVRVTAPPVDSAANEAVVAVLADFLDVPKRAVRVTLGGNSRNKTVEVDGITVDHATERLRVV